MHSAPYSSTIPPELAHAPKPLLVIAGEASGDLHGGEILKALKARCPGLRILGIGGARMKPYLDRQLADVDALGVVGFVEVIRHLPALLKLKRELLRVVREEGVGTALFIDYPGFNMRMAAAFRKAFPGIRLHHYVCPQVWAWKAGRIPVLGETLDALYCLFDFEPALFAGHRVEALWVGHPLVEVVRPEVDRETFFQRSGLDPSRPVVALLPGSRRGEVDRLLPPMMDLVRAWRADPARRAIQWVLPLAPTLPRDYVATRVDEGAVRIVEGIGYAACAHADAALVCSGTATLETALLGTPFAILYRLNPVTYRIAKRLVKVSMIGLSNVVAGRPISTEILQDEVNAARLGSELARLLDPAVAERMRAELLGVRAHLGEPGAADRVAAHLERTMAC